jgi:hypothetical protein
MRMLAVFFSAMLLTTPDILMSLLRARRKPVRGGEWVEEGCPIP